MISILANYSLAQNPQFAIGEELLKAMQNFKPGEILPNYQEKPPEANISQAEDDPSLANLGKEQVLKNPLGQEILKNANNKAPIINNYDSLEMQHAQIFIDNADTVLNEGCYKEPPNCKIEWLKKSCEDYAIYQHIYCGKNLTIDLTTKTDVLSRLIYSLGPSVIQSFSLTEGSIASKISPACLSIKVSAIAYAANSYPLEIIKEPTCQNPTIEIRGIPQGQIILAITVDQTTQKEYWSENDCQEEQIKNCFAAEANICVDGNATKIINGLSFTRPCWGVKSHYACLLGRENNCGQLINAGCSQTGSTCIKTSFNVCEEFKQSFSCPEKICLPEKVICPGKIPCADGSCDHTRNEEANDFAEGLTKLGTLAATAQEVANTQVKESEAKLFPGEVQECFSWPIGLLDCCKGSGPLSNFINCPAELKELQRAKSENRVVFLGAYRNKFYKKKKFVHCVFPTQLSAIIQIQGRGGQLKKSFGSARDPNCGGISPKELEQINFNALNLGPLEAEFKKRTNTNIDENNIRIKNEEHIQQLKEKGRPYD